MRITARILSDGLDRWTSYFPKVDAYSCFPYRDAVTRGCDTDEITHALVQPDYIVHSSDDTHFLRANVARWIVKINDWKKQNMVEVKSHDAVRSVNRMMKRATRDSITFARADWKILPSGDQLRVDVSYDSRDVVNKHQWERMFAWVMSEAAYVLSKELVDKGFKPILLSKRTSDILDELFDFREKEKAKDARAKKIGERFWCSHHRSGYCVADKDGNPPCFDCICYQTGSGKCVNPDEKGGE